MQCAWLLLLVGLLGCAGAERGPAAPEGPGSDPLPPAENMAGPAAEANIAVRNDRAHPRRIIYTASVDLVVEQFEGIPDRVAAIARQFGGYVSGSNVHGQPGQPRRGSWTIRVPVEHYDELLAEAGRLGELRSLTSNSRDVSEEYYDTEARISNKQKTEARIVALLEEATGKLEQVLVVEQKLDQVREEIERMQGRLRVLADQTSLATVTVTVEQIVGYQPEEEPSYRTRVSRAFRGSLHALVALAADLSIALVALSPWLAALAVLGVVVGPILWIVRTVRRRRRKTPSEAEMPIRVDVVDRN